ncbi:hypothetical protein [Kitasatospora griseola]|uniref:hypothetical protein n=1 Tax=Kitasatospora griseola TaxID=2064 RepID=UPI000AD79908|nr:hypothetical protein [Kitasatospora griseola]
METSTVLTPQGHALTADAEFDLVIGDLEQGLPEGGSAHAASTCVRIYCVPNL